MPSVLVNISIFRAGITAALSTCQELFLGHVLSAALEGDSAAAFPSRTAAASLRDLKL